MRNTLRQRSKVARSVDGDSFVSSSRLFYCDVEIDGFENWFKKMLSWYPGAEKQTYGAFCAHPIKIWSPPRT